MFSFAAAPAFGFTAPAMGSYGAPTAPPAGFVAASAPEAAAAAPPAPSSKIALSNIPPHLRNKETVRTRVFAWLCTGMLAVPSL